MSSAIPVTNHASIRRRTEARGAHSPALLFCAALFVVTWSDATSVPSAPSRLSASTTSRSQRPVTEVLRGTLGKFDPSSQELILWRNGRDEHLVVVPETILREGAHRIQTSVLWKFVGHGTKATVDRAAGLAVITNMIISPERVTRGQLESIDPALGALVIKTGLSEQSFRLTPDAWGQLARHVVTLDALAAYAGHSTKVTTSTADGRVISIWVSTSK